MNLGGTAHRGSGIPQQARTVETLISEVSKKVRNLEQTFCCKTDALIAAVEAGSGGGSGVYNDNNFYKTTPGNTFNVDGYFYDIHSASITVLPLVGGDGTETADITISGRTETLPIGTFFNFEASTYLSNNITIEDSSTAPVLVTVIATID